MSLKIEIMAWKIDLGLISFISVLKKSLKSSLYTNISLWKIPPYMFIRIVSALYVYNFTRISKTLRLLGSIRQLGTQKYRAQESSWPCRCAILSNWAASFVARRSRSQLCGRRESADSWTVMSALTKNSPPPIIFILHDRPIGGAGGDGSHLPLT